MMTLKTDKGDIIISDDNKTMTTSDIAQEIKDNLIKNDNNTIPKIDLQSEINSAVAKDIAQEIKDRK